jgi:hypothetical protein
VPAQYLAGFRAYGKIERGVRQGGFLGENITFLLKKSIIRLKFDS